MDIASIIGLLVGVIAILGAQVLESNSISAIIQPSAALVVLGGTFGAVLINFSFPTVIAAFAAVKKVFFAEKCKASETIQQIITLANLSRQQGILSLQEVLDKIDNKFLKRGLMLIIDTSDTQLVHDLLTTEINLEEEQQLINTRVFEAIGGYAPTFGIIGAVLGLIQVMGNLQNPSQLGSGIATAFVATLYGVGLANLVFLPIAGKLKMQLREEIILKEMIIQGLISIQLGENPAIIEEKLFTFLNYASKQNSFLVDLNENGEYS